MTKPEIKTLILNAVQSSFKVKIEYNTKTITISPYLIGLSIMDDEFVYAEIETEGRNYFYTFDLNKIKHVQLRTERFRKVMDYRIPKFAAALYTNPILI